MHCKEIHRGHHKTRPTKSLFSSTGPLETTGMLSFRRLTQTPTNTHYSHAAEQKWGHMLNEPNNTNGLLRSHEQKKCPLHAAAKDPNNSYPCPSIE